MSSPPDPIDDATPEPSSASRSSRLLGVCAAVAIVALILAILAAVDWRQADHSSARTLAQDRDDALIQAHIDISTINTLDYRHVKSGLDRWLSVTTGGLHKQIAQASSTDTTEIEQAKVTTAATVVAAAVTALDVGNGTATVIASVQVQKTPAGGTPVTSRNRYRATLHKVGDQWLISDLKPVQVQLT